jgi:hypothetical protein
MRPGPPQYQTRRTTMVRRVGGRVSPVFAFFGNYFAIPTLFPPPNNRSGVPSPFQSAIN